MMALLAVSCSSESTSLDPNDLVDANVIQLATNTQPALTTKAANEPANLQDQKFVEGTPINIYLTKTGTTTSIAPHANPGQTVAVSDYYEFTATTTPYTGNGSTENSQVLGAPNNYIFQYPGTDGVDVYALHPKTVTKEVNTFSVEEDQTSDDNYKNSDLISAIATNKVKGTGSILLNFDHKLSKVVVKLTTDATENLNLMLEGAKVKMHALKTIGLDHTSVLGDNATGLKLVDGSEADEATIILGTYDAKGTAGIIVPQTVEADKKLFEIELPNKAVFSYIPDADAEKTFEGGKVYIYTLRLKADLITLVSVEIKNWTVVERNGDAILD